MLKLLFTSSEENNNFGVSKVITSLNEILQKKNIRSEYSNNLFKFLIFKPDIIHINGCWKLRLILFFILAKIFRTKVITSPHGMMDPVSLNQKKIKKKNWIIFLSKIYF